MKRRTSNYDVFLSYSMRDAGIAADVRMRLDAAGLSAFDANTASSNDTLRNAIIESAAFVAVVSSSEPLSPWTTTELGAASAWHKSIYLIQAPPLTGALPAYLNHYLVFPMSGIGDLINTIRAGLEPLSEEEKKRLLDVYASLGSPMYQIMTQTTLVDELSAEFNKKRRSSRRSGERLVRELLGLQKRGQLPRIWTKTTSSPSSKYVSSSSSSSSR